MSGLGVRIDVAGAVRDAAAEFERFAIDRFPRAVQFALTGVVIDAANAFRRDIPNIWDVPNRATRGALRYVVDRELLNRVTMVGEAQASVFVQDLPSIWLKYSFGNGPQTRTGGDVWEGESVASDPLRFRVRVFQGADVVRAFEVDRSEAVYAVAEIAADFPGGVGTSARVGVAQSDGRMGWGDEATVAFTG